MTPDRTQLQHMVKRDNESFKEYAQRWRGLAAQVAPPLPKKEMVSMFMETLPSHFYEKLIGSVSSGFSDMVVIGERLENGLRNGKIAHYPTGTPSQKKPFAGYTKKKEGETNAITGPGKPSYSNPSHTTPFSTQTPPTPPTQNNQGYRPQNYPDRKFVQFDPIPMSYSDLFHHLLGHNLITPRPMRQIQPPFPRGFDPNTTCEFHSRTAGHSIENYKALKYVVQDLITSGWLNFKKDGPNVATNTLPGHVMPSTNAVEDSAGQSLIRKVEHIQTPLEEIRAKLCSFGIIEKECTGKNSCNDLRCVGNCEAFKQVSSRLVRPTCNTNRFSNERRRHIDFPVKQWQE